MPLSLAHLPTSPPYDPTADAGGSSDPLGTQAGSERLAEVLLPGFTARMWRARLLTLSVVAADIAAAVVQKSGDQEELRLKARLAFERLFVSSLVRCEEAEPSRYSGVSRRIPGRRIARRALHTGDEPLTGQNFIKGQAVNGPTGVMSRLARNLGLLDEEGRVTGEGDDLKSAWARSVTETGQDGQTNEHPGARFCRTVVSAVLEHVRSGTWPKRKASVWLLLTDALRPDRVPIAERRLLGRLLDEEPNHQIRPRVLRLLREERCLEIYGHGLDADDRGLVERSVLQEGVRTLLADGPVDRLIESAVRTIDAFERFSVSLGVVFNRVLWGLRAVGGSGSPERLLEVGEVLAAVHWCLLRLGKLLPELRAIHLDVASETAFEEQRVPDLIDSASRDAENALVSATGLLDAVLKRHERVQRDKQKPIWVARSTTWTLMPGTPVPEPRPLDGPESFLHPYRVLNAYALLRDLRLVKGVRSYDKTDGEE